ncbi:MAG TPA: hypothetical protein VFK70_03275, partial [Vicinamibacteria bacterium]|nr:hypothetical protein [Vicinamibacteria bacterium]
MQQAITLVGVALLATALAGCVARGRYREWWFFCLYLLTVLVTETLMLAAPARFHTPEFWGAKEIVIAGLRLALACEVGVRTMRAFPGALATTRRVVFLILLVTLIAVVKSPPAVEYRSWVGELQPRVLNGSIWMLTAIAGVILFYRLPVRPLHKAILLSYLPYVLVLTILLSYLGSYGWPRGVVMQYVGQLAYVTLVAYWNYAI